MQIYEKVKEYLLDNVGNMALPGTPVFNEKEKLWEVPILCRTDKGIFIIGQVYVNENEEIFKVPDVSEMLKILRTYAEKLPFLVYAEKDELEKKGVKTVSI